jgi:hypothetical protein
MSARMETLERQIQRVSTPFLSLEDCREQDDLVIVRSRHHGKLSCFVLLSGSWLALAFRFFRVVVWLPVVVLPT